MAGSLTTGPRGDGGGVLANAFGVARQVGQGQQFQELAAHGALVGLAPGAGSLRGGVGLCPRQSGKGQQRNRQTGRTARYLTLTLARTLPRIPTA